MVLASINGKFNTHIPVTDRGLLFGESVYEVIPVYNNLPFQLDAHLERLEKGFAFVSPRPLPLDKIRLWIKQYIQKLPKQFFNNIYVQVTSGEMVLRDHMPAPTIPNCIIQQTKQQPVSIESYAQGFKAICLPDKRSALAEIKTNHLTYNTQALEQAQKRGYHDAIFVRNHCVTEAVSSNFFAVIHGTIVTPPTTGILSGLTRTLVLELIKEQNLSHEIAPITLNDLTSATEVFLTSSTRIMRPLVEIEGLFQAPNPGPIWLRLFHSYFNKIYEACGQPTN